MLRDPIKQRAYKKKYRATEKGKATHRAYEAAHKKMRQAINKKWRKAHPQYSLKWERAHKEQRKVQLKLRPNEPALNRARQKKHKRKWSVERWLWWNVKTGIRARNKKGEVSDLKESDIVIPKLCPVFKIPLFRVGGKRTDNSPSIDRIDNTKGYTKDNVWIISWRANRLKNDGTATEFRQLAKAITKAMKKAKR